MNNNPGNNNNSFNDTVSSFHLRRSFLTHCLLLLLLPLSAESAVVVVVPHSLVTPVLPFKSLESSFFCVGNDCLLHPLLHSLLLLLSSLLQPENR